MRLLITGAGGMLGRDVTEAAAGVGHQVTPLGRAELDITDPDAMAAAVSRSAPDCVLNCAAYTDVDQAQSEPARAQAVNAGGAGILAHTATAAGAWVLHVSSDYVFDGTKAAPYVESDQVAPLSVYGSSKLGGERAVAREAPQRHTIVRSSWLFGAGGQSFPATILRLAPDRDRLTVVADQIGCPTFTGHLSRALVELAERQVPGIVHAAAGGHCSWCEFAREIVARAGYACDIVPGTTAELGRPAERPRYSVLGTERPDVAPRLADWHEGLGDFLGSVVPR